MRNILPFSPYCVVASSALFACLAIARAQQSLKIGGCFRDVGPRVYFGVPTSKAVSFGRAVQQDPASRYKFEVQYRFRHVTRCRRRRRQALFEQDKPHVVLVRVASDRDAGNQMPLREQRRCHCSRGFLFDQVTDPAPVTFPHHAQRGDGRACDIPTIL